MNGIPVSRPPKIGERPYPCPFHPVENGGKIEGKPPKSTHTATSQAQSVADQCQINLQMPKNPNHQVFRTHLQIDVLEPLVSHLLYSTPHLHECVIELVR